MMQFVLRLLLRVSLLLQLLLLVLLYTLITMEDEVLEALPESFQNRVIETQRGQSCLIKSSIQTYEDWKRWLDEYSRKSFTSWNVVEEVAPSARKGYRGHYICHHSAFNRSEFTTRKCHRATDFNCQAQLWVKIRLVGRKEEAFRTQSLFSCIIRFENCHNHSRQSAEELQQLKLLNSTRDTYFHYFDLGISKRQAWQYHQLRIILSSNLSRISRSENPTQRTVFSLQRLWEKLKVENENSKYNSRQSQTSKEFHTFGIRKAVQVYADRHPEDSIIIQTKDGHFIIALVTQFMRKCHTVFEKTRKFCYVGTAIHQNRNIKTGVVSFLGVCPIGSVPLGIVFVSEQTSESYQKGFHFLREAIGQFAFHGQLQPSVFMSDDSKPLRDALQQVWPSSFLAICPTYLLHSARRWLCNESSQLSANYHLPFLNILKKLINAAKYEDYTKIYQTMKMGYSVSETFSCYMETYCKRPEEWSPAFQKDPTMKELFSAKCCQFTMYIIKDISHRLKDFNAVSLITYLSEMLSKYLQRCFFDVLEGKERIFYNSDVINNHSFLDTDNEFIIKDKVTGAKYTADLRLELCSCQNLYSTRPCNHLISCAEIAMFKLTPALKVNPGVRNWLVRITKEMDASSSRVQFPQLKQPFSKYPIGSLHEEKDLSCLTVDTIQNQFRKYFENDIHEDPLGSKTSTRMQEKNEPDFSPDLIITLTTSSNHTDHQLQTMRKPTIKTPTDQKLNISKNGINSNTVTLKPPKVTLPSLSYSETLHVDEIRWLKTCPNNDLPTVKANTSHSHPDITLTVSKADLEYHTKELHCRRRLIPQRSGYFKSGMI